MRKILILIAALALLAGCSTFNSRLENTKSTTGLGTSPFATGGSFTAAQANAIANAIDDNAGDIAELVSLSGVAADSTTLGSGFTGTTIPDGSTIFAALQAIETAYESTLPVPEAYDQLGYENDYGAVTKHDLQAKIETMGGSGDITSVWDVTSGAATRLYQASIVFGDGDATPDVSAGNIFITANTGATTITDFDTSLVNGQPIWIIVNDSNTTFSFAGGLEGVGTENYVARNGDLIQGMYSTEDSQWHMLYPPSSIGTVSLQEGILWADADGTGSIVWAFATSAARTITVPGDANDTLATLAQNNAFTGNMTVAGTIQGRAVFNSYDAAQTLTQAVHNGSLVRLTVADEITLWDCTASNIGSFVTLWARDSEKIEVVPASGDQFVLTNGTALDANNELDIADTAGTKVCLMCTEENIWSVYSETAASTDGGAAD